MRDLLDAHGALVRASGNKLLAHTEEPLRTRVKFLTPRDAAAVDFEALAHRADMLVSILNGWSPKRPNSQPSSRPVSD